MGNIQSVSYRMPQRVLDDIDDERSRQDKKWGDQSQNSNPVWAAILTEEVGEVAQAVLKAQWLPRHDPGSLNWCKRCGADLTEKTELIASTEPCPGFMDKVMELRDELIQVAAVAVAWIEVIDKGIRIPSVMTGEVVDD